MNIKSIYYKREFDVVLNQQDDGSGLISHDSLRDVIYNQCEGILHDGRWEPPRH